MFCWSIQFIFTFNFKKFYELSQLEKTIAADLQIRDISIPIYAFYVDVSLPYRGVSNEIRNMWITSYENFQKSAFVLFNVTKFKKQWANTNPMINWENMNKAYNLVKITSYKSGWHLYYLENRILYITPSFPADENDSRCIPALQDFFIERSKRGFQDHIIALSYPCKGNYEWHGHHVESLGWGLPNKFKKWFLIQQATQQILKKIETYNFDLVHSFWLTDASLVAVNLCKQLQIKHLVTVMGQDVVSSYYTKRLILVSAPQLVFLSDFQKQQFYISSYPSETIP